MLNTVQIQGRFTSTPELKKTGDGVSVTSFTLAVDRDFVNKATGQRDSDFFRCNAWRAQAEWICRFFRKGDHLAVSGHLQTKTWNDTQGVSRQDTEIVVDNAYFCGPSRRRPDEDQPKAVEAQEADPFDEAV